MTTLLFKVSRAWVDELCRDSDILEQIAAMKVAEWNMQFFQTGYTIVE